ncbi:transglutaminase-like domain-containing protein [Microbacterium album]|uniref:Cysteine protease n=1 Tax=Microbacterium album TaxID=2053191 RepID=A0A917IJN1_9MICO|nr:transglutaminase-like domain-containing protein [Microbacterium album]GGH50885.1 cysteine protease [Microbacterium album]
MTATMTPPVSAEASPPAPAPRRRATRRARTPLDARRWALDLGAVALLLLVPVIGFWPTFDGPIVLLPGIGGLAVALGLAALGARRGWGVLTLAASVVAAYFVLGGPLALPHTAIGGVIPTVETFRRLAAGAVQSWKSLLTTVAPVAPEDGHLLVPFLLVLVLGTLAASLALRVMPAAWALVPAVACLALQIALGTSEPAVPIVQGVLLAVVAIVWLAVRDAWAPARSAIAVGTDDAPAADRAHLLRRIATAAGVLGVAAAVGAASTLLAPANEVRYVLRDVIIPPFDIRDYPSPLQSFRLYVEKFAEEPLFTVSGLPEGARVRLGAMDAYSGVVYNVSDASSAFTPLRSNMAADAEGESVELRVVVQGYDDVWLPGVGRIDALTYDGPRADELRRGTYYNPATGTGVVTPGLREGDAYTLQAVLPPEPSDAVLAEDVFAPVDVPQPRSVPNGIAELAADAISNAEASTPVEKVQALATYLVESGFFSHGQDGEFSPSGHGSARIAMLTGGDQMVGDDEQYAVLMALMAHEVGIPARVVMGFHSDERTGSELVATGDNLHAWVEVPFRDAGWVAFDPTPDEDKDPKDQTTQPQADPQPMPLQPPPPPKEEADEPPLVPDERETEDEAEPLPAFLGLLLAVGGIGLGTILLLLAPFVIIGGLKAARRRKRREAPAPADRLSGGWDELMDRAADFGRTVPVGATRYEQSLRLRDAIEEPRITALAVRADAGVFGPGDPSPTEIDAFWNEVDQIVGGMTRKASFWARLRARLNVRTLIAGSRLATRTRDLRESVAQRRTQLQGAATAGLRRAVTEPVAARRGGRPASRDARRTAARDGKGEPT